MTFDLENLIEEALNNDALTQQRQQANYTQRVISEQNAKVLHLYEQLSTVIPPEMREALNMRVELRIDDPNGHTTGLYCAFFEYQNKTVVFAWSNARKRWVYFPNCTAVHHEYKLEELFNALLLALGRAKLEAE